MKIFRIFFILFLLFSCDNNEVNTEHLNIETSQTLEAKGYVHVGEENISRSSEVILYTNFLLVMGNEYYSIIPLSESFMYNYNIIQESTMNSKFLGDSLGNDILFISYKNHLADVAHTYIKIDKNRYDVICNHKMTNGCFIGTP